MRIVIIGPSGIGKTSIGKKISELKKVDFYDMDFLLHNQFNFAKKESYSQEEIYEKKKLELDIFSRVLDKKEFILSTCGGLIEEQFKENLSKISKKLKTQENVILLLPYKDITKSKKFLMKRFNISVITRHQSLKFDRDIKIFRMFAKKIFYTQNKSIEEITQKILDVIK